jgi:hypothetical protein
MGIPFLGRIPLDTALREASDAALRRRRPADRRQRFAAIARELLDALETAAA